MTRKHPDKVPTFSSTLITFETPALEVCRVGITMRDVDILQTTRDTTQRTSDHPQVKIGS